MTTDNNFYRALISNKIACCHCYEWRCQGIKRKAKHTKEHTKKDPIFSLSKNSETSELKPKHVKGCNNLPLV